MLDHTDQIQNICADIRRDIFLTAYAGGIGHLASAFSLVEILYSLYLNGIMKYSADNPQDESRDMFILSKGHGSLALYNTLYRAGFFPRETLWGFCRPNGILGGEPHNLEVPGIEAATGSLGHGLSIGVGMAMAIQQSGLKNHVYVVVGDGECQEGSIWEAIMTAAAYQLECLTLIIDNNKLQKNSRVEELMKIDSWNNRLCSFGWAVKKCDGHDVGDITRKLQESWEAGKPRCLIANTVKGKGLSLMENNPKWHWKMPNRRELKVFMEELHISEEELVKC